jgi:GNAT superfamily N-acetyltransferase
MMFGAGAIESLRTDAPQSSEAVPVCDEIRRLAERDYSAVRDLLFELDIDSRWHRFGAPVSDPVLEQHAGNLLQDAALALGAYANRKLCGLLELYPRNHSGTLELWLVVARNWRRQGMASRLVGASLHEALPVDARYYEFTYAGDNWPMRRIAQKLGARIDLTFGAHHACVEVGRQWPAPTHTCSLFASQAAFTAGEDASNFDTHLLL